MVSITQRTLILSLSMIGAGAAQPQQSAEAKVQRLVTGSGYANQHPSAKAWVIPAKGPAIGDYKVFVAVSGDIVVVCAGGAPKRHIPLPPPLFPALLQSKHYRHLAQNGLGHHR